MRFLKDKYFYWKLKEFLFVERSQKSKVFYVEINFQHSFFKIFSLQKKKKSQFTLFCFVHRTVLCLPHSIQFRCDLELLGPSVQKDNHHNVLWHFAYSDVSSHLYESLMKIMKIQSRGNLLISTQTLIRDRP